MLLVVTNRDDLTADWLILELRDRQAPFVRFNTEDYPHDVSLRWTPAGDTVLSWAGEQLNLADVTSVWFRRPVAPRAPDGVEDELAAWAVREAQEALDGIWKTLDARWVNHPDANQLASCKPEQLARASRAGFETPPTLVTNQADELQTFAEHVGSRLVCKPLYEGWLPAPSGDRVFWTSPLDVADTDRLLDLGPEPYLFQALVPKAYDIRVTVIGNEAFAVGIGSQAATVSEVDWRRGDVEALEHWVEELPDDLARRCVELVAGYGLSFGALDFAYRPDGGYTFFELNPNGQWAWLEQLTDLPLRARLADLMLGTA
jgi:glutathione synthase/RimK-type ligase-like ATP-grasp enzyme